MVSVSMSAEKNTEGRKQVPVAQSIQELRVFKKLKHDKLWVWGYTDTTAAQLHDKSGDCAGQTSA